MEFISKIPNQNKYANILTFIKMNYLELVNCLLKKYGKVNDDFIVISKYGNARKNNKILRTKEGLQVHHIDEYEMPALSLSAQRTFRIQDLHYHKAERLVYANLLEHLLLHIKIYQESKYNEVQYAVGFGGVYLLVENNINSYYKNEPNTNWHQYMYAAIKESFEDYILLLSYWLYIAEDNKLNLHFHHNYFNNICQRMAVCYDGSINEDVYNSLVALINEMQLKEIIKKKECAVNNRMSRILNESHKND